MLRVDVIKALQDIRASYWFVPLCMLVTAIALALITRSLDTHPVVEQIADSSLLKASGVDDARTILSVIATSILGVAGVTFSITIVAVSFASSNFGPRLVGNFMRDLGNQITLGTFIGTFVFCLIILASVQGASSEKSGAEAQELVPYLSVITALFLALVCVCVLIYYIHHIAETINIENIIADIGSQLKARILETYPNNQSDVLKVDATDFETAVASLAVKRVSSKSVGYVQAIDHEKLSEMANSMTLLIKVHYRPGDYVCTHDALLSVWSNESDTVPVDDLRDCFATGPQRTEHQNVLFLVEQLGEVIARALSPGVNDPMTAVSCLNWYRTALMGYINAHPEALADSDWASWQVQIKPVTFDRICAVMFDKTMQYIVADTTVLLHAMAVFSECAWQARVGPYRETLKSHLQQYHLAGIETHDKTFAAKIINDRFEQASDLLENDDPFYQKRQDATWFGGSA